MHATLLRTTAFLTAVVVASCDDPDGTTSGVIGINGGRIAVSEGALVGAALEIPPDSLEREQSFWIRETVTPDLPPNVIAVGPAADFGTLGGAEFRRYATATLPTDPALVPAGATPRDLRVLLWDGAAADGEFFPVRGVGIEDPIASFELRRTSRAMLVVRTDDRDASAFTWLPLLFGSSYRYDDGSIWELRSGEGEPGLEARRRIAYLDTGDLGAWLSFDFSGFALLGVRDTAIDARFLATGPFGLLSAVPPELWVRRETFDYARYDGAATTASERGSLLLDVREERLEEFETPLGRFTDVVRLEVRPPLGEAWARFWLAREVGVIGYEFPSLSRAGRLVEGIVGGVSIEAR